MQRAIIVTGASDGIGAALALAFAHDADPLVLVARSREGLERTADAVTAKGAPAPLVLALDLTAPGALDALEAMLAREGLVAHVLVNNAGYGLHGAAADLDRADQLGIVDLNARVATDLALRLLPGMMERGAGGILNVASLAGLLPGPYMAVYYASKAYVLSLSEALAIEAARRGVTVSALCPGPTHSGFGRRAGFRNHGVVDRYGAMTAEEVARIGRDGFRAGRRVIVPGWKNRFAAALARLAPRRLALAVVAAAQRTRD